MAHNYDPAKEACSPEFYYNADTQMPIAGPGGNHQLTENNEKGILETHLLQVPGKTAALQGDHNRQGIYAS